MWAISQLANIPLLPGLNKSKQYQPIGGRAKAENLPGVLTRGQPMQLLIT